MRGYLAAKRVMEEVEQKEQVPKILSELTTFLKLQES